MLKLINFCNSAYILKADLVLCRGIEHCIMYMSYNVNQTVFYGRGQVPSNCGRKETPEHFMPKSICTTFFQNDAKVINFLHKLQNKFLVLNFCEIKANLHTVKSTNIKRDLPVLLTWYTANLYTISFSLSFSMLDQQRMVITF